MLHFVLWLAYLIDSSKAIKVGGKQKPYEMWQAGNSLAASPLANSSRASPERNIAALPPLARSRIPPATQAIPWSQRLSFILYWQILRREPLLLFFFCWHEALRAAKRKPLVETVGNLTFMSSAFDRRFWLEDIFNCSTSHMIGWIKYLWGW